jgi:formate hydrogenlyase transcriptional activator
MSKRTDPPGTHLGYPGLDEPDKRDTLFQSAPVGLCFLDRELRFVQVNDRLARIDGLPVEQHLGKTIGQVLPPPLVEKVEPLCRKVLETGRPLFDEGFWGPSPSEPEQEDHHWLVNLKPVEGEGHEVDGVCLAVRDDTDQVRKQQHLEERLDFEALLAGLSSRFVNLPADRVDGEINKALELVVAFFHIDRGSVVMLSGDEHEMQGTHTFAAEGHSPFPRIAIANSMPFWSSVIKRGEVYAMNSVGDLPAEAAPEKAFCAKLGIKSTVQVPLHIGGRVNGVIGFSTLRAEREWSDEDVERLRLVCDIFSNALERQRAEQELEHQLRFEQLIADLSARFVNLPADRVDREIESAYKIVVEFLGVSRCGLVEFSADGTQLRVRHVYAVEGVEQSPPPLLSESYPNYTRAVAQGAPFHMTSDEMPVEWVEEQEYVRQSGIKSNLSIPLKIGGRLLGLLTLDSFDIQRKFSTDFIDRLALVGQIFANAVARQRMERELRRSFSFEHLIADLSSRFIHIPAEQVDQEIENAQWLVMEALGLQRCDIGIFSEDGKVLRIVHSCVTDGGRPLTDVDVTSDLPYFSATLIKEGVFQFSGLDQLPESAAEEREYVKRFDIKSTLSFLLNIGETRLGAMAFGTSAEREWPDPLVEQLRLVGEIFANAMARQVREQEIERLKNQLETENIYLREEISTELRYEEMVAQSKSMKVVVKQAEKVAATDSTVLLSGETGTGKEVLARAIHAFSSRRERVMVKVNCAALPSTLVESELFGREEGAFTGALTKQLGRFEVADGSTIFLDEISELPLELQSKLLRVLQEGEFERLGSPETVSVDVRVIAASNKDLEQAVADNQFREDLLYRLNVFPLTLPPLRERREDVAPLVWKFVEEFGEKMGKPIETIPRKTMELIESHPWPGNIRELRNVIERAMILAEGSKLRVELPRVAGTAAARPITMTELEQSHIIDVLEKTGWKVSGSGGAADILGLKPTTLESRMKKLGISRPR